MITQPTSWVDIREQTSEWDCLEAQKLKNDDAPINYGGRGENIKGQNPNDVNTPGRGLRQHSEGMSEMSEANERFPS